MSSAMKTTDHDQIRKWAEARGGRPSRVAGIEDDRGEGVLRLDFGEKEESLEEISWDDFFKTFDDRHLAFLYQDEVGQGGTSRFFKFVRRDDTEGRG